MRTSTSLLWIIAFFNNHATMFEGKTTAGQSKDGSRVKTAGSHFLCTQELIMDVLLDAANFVERRTHGCSVCGVAFRCRTGLRQHMLTHSADRPYACGKCAKAFRRKNARDVHFLTHSGIRSHACTHPACGKAFRTRETLKQHMLTHSDVLPHKCEVCGRGFRRKCARDIHMCTHGRARAFKCHCDKTFAQKHHLVRHRLHCPSTRDTHRPGA